MKHVDSFALPFIRRRLRFIWRYWRGDVPWDSGIVPPEITAWIAAYSGPPGRALDLGCGTGTTSVYLASLGWDVVGVDFAPNAVAQARTRARHQARRAGRRLRARFISADVAHPRLLRDETPFDLLIDVGCMHGLLPAQQVTYAANLARLARPGAAYLLYAFMPALSRDGRRTVGLSPDDVAALFAPAFTVESYTVGEEVTTPRPSAWYTLRRVEDRL